MAFNRSRNKELAAAQDTSTQMERRVENNANRGNSALGAKMGARWCWGFFFFPLHFSFDCVLYCIQNRNSTVAIMFLQYTSAFLFATCKMYGVHDTEHDTEQQQKRTWI